jgi:FtsK/SpoIIIE family.
VRISFGINAYNQRCHQRQDHVVWDSQTAMNGHIMVMGGSGSGKTHTVQQLLNE